MAERIRTLVGTEPVSTADGVIPVTLSMGVTFGGQKQEEEVEAILRAADSALYRAKRAGRNRVEITSADG